ncbi:hypothetical protein NGB36_00915 [Streptomyces sp. RB6PN25]|uniref:RND transporter n=1 Tax=Streptomyces humicola TaxID=2953240 RepID=A0ABT1PNF7_9ACTN|nr:hypothetical protein [Streptomyces humicola]MCQ4079212.1 hypothetical protein [Streptomyces humicola]
MIVRNPGSARPRRRRVVGRATTALRAVAAHRRGWHLAHPCRWTRRGIALALALVLVCACGAAGLARVRVETTLDSFLPAGDSSLAQLDRVEQNFGGDPIVVLLESSQPQQLLDPGHVLPELRLEGTLAKLPNVASVYGPATALNQIAGQAQDVLAELTGRRDAARALAVAQAKQAGDTDAQANAAGQHALEQFDARYGPLMIQAMPTGLPTLSNARFVSSVIYDGAGGVRPQWHFIVPSVTSVAILVRPRQGMDAGSIRGLVDAVHQTVSQSAIDAQHVTVSGVPVIASSIGDEVAREVPLIGGLAVLAVGVCFLLVPWCRWRRRLLPVCTTLIAIALTLAVFGWIGRPLSLGVVAFLSVLLGVGSYYPTYFAQRARTRTVLSVAGGSAASFATLLTSPLPFVRDLGMTLSLGVVMSALVGMLLVRRFARTTDEARDDAPEAARPRATRWVVVVGVVAVAMAGIGWRELPTMPLQANVESFASGLPALKDAQHVESVMGSSGEADIVLSGPDVTSPAAFDWMRRAQDVVVSAYGDRMRPALSLPTLLMFLGDHPSSEQLASGLRLIPPYLSTAVVSGDDHTGVMVFGVRMDDLEALHVLRDDVLRSLPPAPQGYQVSLTGLPMVAVRGEELVSAGRVPGNLLGILVAGAVLAVGLRRRTYALRAVAAALIATGLGLCALWATHIPLSAITAALGPLTAAVSCEFTVLLAESKSSGNISLRRSVLLATATSAVGYLVLVGSGLAAIQQFGVLLAGAVVLALGSAVLVVRLTAPRRSARIERTHSEEKVLTGVSQ